MFALWPIRRLGLLALLLGVCLLLGSGCSGVQRRLTIRSNPAGARVYVDGFDIGVTPVSTDFLYYGTREIKLVKDGYETLTVEQEIPAPWFQIPPLDFVSDNLLPKEIRDERVATFDLSPQVVVPIESLMQRAEGLRQDANLQASFQGGGPGLPGAGGPSVYQTNPPMIPSTTPELLPTPATTPGPLFLDQAPGMNSPGQLPAQTLPSEGIPLPPLETLPLEGPAPERLGPSGAPPVYAP